MKVNNINGVYYRSFPIHSPGIVLLFPRLGDDVMECFWLLRGFWLIFYWTESHFEGPPFTPFFFFCEIFAGLSWFAVLIREVATFPFKFFFLFAVHPQFTVAVGEWKTAWLSFVFLPSVGFFLAFCFFF